LEPESGLTVAITGPTGTFGAGLVPLLQDDGRVDSMVGIARRPFDPSSRGWTKMEYRRGDVRDQAALEDAFAGADVVVHLAFLILGGNEETTRAINVDGTMHAFRAAARAGARRFVYASSVAAYGFHPDNPAGMTEDWPTRPAVRHFYAREKAELEHLLEGEAAAHPEVALYVLRPSIVLGPDAVGGKVAVPGWLAAAGRAGRRALRAPVPVPVLVPDLPVQFIHQDDVGQALRLCVVAAGPPGAYNIAAEETLRLPDVAREIGARPFPVSGTPVSAAARLTARLPLLPSYAQWVEALGNPPVMDISRAQRELGWRPRHSAREAIRATWRH
jgi:nucleoside-diphosphate-sugar epimerase